MEPDEEERLLRADEPPPIMTPPFVPMAGNCPFTLGIGNGRLPGGQLNTGIDEFN